MEYLLDINNLDENTLHNIKLHSPVPIQGGSYLAKITLNDNPLLFQMPTCSTKRGVVTSNKRYYCDLLFNYDHNNVIDFVENLETIVRDKVFAKNELWFQDPPSIEEIEYNWNDSIKQTKQNFYLRTYVGTVKNVGKSVSVYNSNQEQISIDSILPSSNIITIVEITGLKFSSSSFHINYCLRQIMVLEEKKPIFNKCLINLTKPSTITYTETNNETNSSDLEKVSDTTNMSHETQKQNDITMSNVANISLENQPSILDNVNEKGEKEHYNDNNNDANNNATNDANNNDTNDDLEILSPDINTSIETMQPHEQYPDSDTEIEQFTSNNTSTLEETPNTNDNEPSTDVDVKQSSTDDTNNISHTPTPIDLNMDSLEIKEVNLQIPEEEELFQLKKPDTVYLDMYRKALEKAKDAKIKAIQAYLELKNIKNKYMIQEVDEDDDNFGELNFDL